MPRVLELNSRGTISTLSPHRVRNHIIHFVAVALASVLASACAPPHRSAGVTSPDATRIATQLNRYRTAVMAMNYDTIASVFTADASLSHESQPPITSRDSIRKFLMSFAAYHVTAYDLVADSTVITGPAASADGHYAQTVRLPDGSTVNVSGTFHSMWRREPDGVWRISALHTASPPRS